MFYEGPSFSDFDASKIKHESEMLFNDKDINEGFVTNLPKQYAYLNSLDAESIYKRDSRISITIWKFWTSQKKFVLFSSAAEANKHSNRTRGWNQLTGLLYTQHSDG